MGTMHTKFCWVCKKDTIHHNMYCGKHQPLEIQEFAALTWGSNVPMPDPQLLAAEKEYSREHARPRMKNNDQRPQVDDRVKSLYDDREGIVNHTYGEANGVSVLWDDGSETIPSIDSIEVIGSENTDDLKDLSNRLTKIEGMLARLTKSKEKE